jgi:uncharacterized membrane protein YccC
MDPTLLAANSGSWLDHLSSERSRLLIHAAKTTLAATIAWFVAQALGFNDGYWAVITVIIVLQSYVGSTVTASRDRAIGTLIGAVFGFAFSLYSVQPWNFLLALTASTVVCVLLGLKGSTRLAGVTVIIIMIQQKHAMDYTIALHRVIEVLLGIAIALAVSTIVLPERARIRLREGLAEEFLQLGAFFEAVLKGFSGTPDERLNDLRTQCDNRRRTNNQLMDTARNEPSGGVGILEASGMLSQFARSLRDALAALELSVRNSNNDHFAQQLEPELGKLATDIHATFHFVAGCIHRWKFNVPLGKLSLAADIAALEQKMDSLRHMGTSFSQEEVLRAYAVQLHLKQIARILRTVRTETGRTLEERKMQEESA